MGVHLLELIPMKKILVLMIGLVKYRHLLIVKKWRIRKNKRQNERTKKRQRIINRQHFKKTIRIKIWKKTFNKIKVCKMDFQKNTTNNIKMADKQYAKKRKHYCFVCKKKTDNEKIRAVASVNKIAKQRLLWLLLLSTFLKAIKPITNKTNKKQK